ncbi:MAG: class I SAM-dependent methyltransferase, partial [Myxococcales bacterium]|nr:class I SAM-dependent methyltransferase [Myxococcales bacterium]
MERAQAIWPEFRPEWVLFEDDSIVVVNKPPGVSTQAANPAVPDDLVTRLRRFLSERNGAGPELPYLGVHQRLDKGTSGAMVFTKDPAANAGLARQFEERTIEKGYVAGVIGWKGSTPTTLEHWLSRQKGRSMAVDRKAVPGAKKAVLFVDEARKRGPRTLLRVRLGTGRTHQIRAQLAAEGAPVVGDAEYGREPGPRLLLHAYRLRFTHPVTGEGMDVEAPLPACFNLWLEGEGMSALADRDGPPGRTAPTFRDALEGRLRDALEARFGLGRRSPDTDCFRLVHGAADGLPGMALDRYGDFLVAHLEEGAVIGGGEGALDAVGDLGFRGVYVKYRPRQANELVDTRRDDLAPAHAVRGEDAPEEFTVFQHGLPFRVRLGDGLSTGLFLDQRMNREYVRDTCRGLRVLNLFAYTCPFTVAAAAGGAAETVSVDVARPAIDWGQRNVEALGSDGAHRFVREDVFPYLERLGRRGERFDLVLVDPPTYATTKRSRFRSGADWVRLAEAVAKVVHPGGRLLCCS